MNETYVFMAGRFSGARTDNGLVEPAHLKMGAKKLARLTNNS